MEKKEAVREYCIDRAIDLCVAGKEETYEVPEDIIKIAKILEEYISSPPQESQPRL